MNKKLLITLSLVGILIVAVVGSIFVNMGMSWYKQLVTPTNFLPNYIIPIVWTVIYSAFAVYVIFAISNEEINITTFVLLMLNGIFNILWCLLFFTLNSTLLGMIAIVINLVLAILLIISISNTNKIFAYILTIYPKWVGIATTLNLALWILN